MRRVFEALSSAGCDVVYGLKMHAGQEEFYLKELRQFAYDTTIRKLDSAVSSGDAGKCYLYSKALLPIYAGLGFMPALYVSDSIAESAKRGMIACLPSLFAKLDELHSEYTKIIRIN